ncbi:hypothetical protein [uncultured Chryseobacterium sp.]|uniref:hypothetical protein n=1 Tax=uncultured Chryseobacterium sp. TaxID=259322 RepID=UPI0025FCC4D9|nr:hypothetical protein [uncultured Chryseobacterium sp.]
MRKFIIQGFRFMGIVSNNSSLYTTSFYQFSTFQRNFSTTTTTSFRYFHTRNIPFDEVTPTVMRKYMPKTFLEALKTMGRTEDDIINYYTRYHNENGFQFLNKIEGLVAKNDNLTITDAFTLWSYTTNHYYGDLNDWLRNGINAAHTQDIAKLLDNALDKMPTYSGPAYRALGFSDTVILQSFLKKHRKDEIVVYNEFVSSGSNSDAAFFNKPEKNVFMIMEVKGAPIISDFSDGIRFRGYQKHELLLKRKRKLKVVDSTSDGYKHYLRLVEN